MRYSIISLGAVVMVATLFAACQQTSQSTSPGGDTLVVVTPPGLLSPASEANADNPVIHSARRGDPEAQRTLGMAYWHGQRIADTVLQPDLDKARYWLLQAARQGDAQAQYQLGELLLSQSQTADALGWYKAAGEQGDVQALYRLGQLYRDGQAITGDLERAAHYWQQAADRGYAPAEYALGLMHTAGDGVQRDTLRALQWLHWAAAHGHSQAQFELGRMYCEGTATNVEADLCRHWLLMAASSGNQAAQNELERRGWLTTQQTLTTFTEEVSEDPE